MKSVATFIFLSLIVSCSDVEPLELDPRDASRLEGVWYQYPNEEWVWHFHASGVLEQSIFGLNAELWENKRLYETRRDTLETRGFLGNDVRTYTVGFEGDSAATLTNTDGIGINHKLIRF